MDTVNKNCIETIDIFLCAFLLCSGGRLSNVCVNKKSKRVVSFFVEGANITKLEDDYKSGYSSVDPLMFKKFLFHLIPLHLKWTGKAGEISNDNFNETPESDSLLFLRYFG